jgi:KDO2-lipid IV(A) lauroyltransferase
MSGELSRPSWFRRLRYRLEYAALRAAVWTIPKLPLRLVRWTGGVLGTLTWLGDARGRRTGMENLRVALGPGLAAGQRRRILRASYRGFARTFVELFWSPRIGVEQWDRFFILQYDTEAAREAAESNRCLIVTAHLAGFELMNVGKTLKGMESMTIAQDFKNPALTGVFARLRSAGGRQEMIPQEGAMLRLFRHLKRGGSAGALVDLKVNVIRDGMALRTFGMWTSFSGLHCVLAQRTGLPVLPLIPLPSPDGRCLIRVCDPIQVGPEDSIPAAMQRCWSVFEDAIRARPEQWLWMYKHWRYLPEGADPTTYPGYARSLPEFDQLLVRSGAGAA